MDRRQPWGPSVFINALGVDDGADGDRILEIEMQSGDTIRCVCEAIEMLDCEKG